jgi:hypothetical protein
MTKDDPYVRLRIPQDLKQFVQESAKRNQRSMNGEIVFVLSQQREATSAPTA